MRDIRRDPISVDALLRIVRGQPSITTPELAELLGVSPSIARWAVYESGVLEYYNGWHIREKTRSTNG